MHFNKLTKTGKLDTLRSFGLRPPIHTILKSPLYPSRARKVTFL